MRAVSGMGFRAPSGTQKALRSEQCRIKWKGGWNMTWKTGLYRVAGSRFTVEVLGLVSGLQF